MATKKNKFRDLKPQKDAKGGGGGGKGGGVHQPQGAIHSPDASGKGGTVSPIKNPEQ